MLRIIGNTPGQKCKGIDGGVSKLELQNISFAAEGKEILREVNLKIEDRFVAVTGPNGGGKSTLAKVIMGIDKPDAGRILLDG